MSEHAFLSPDAVATPAARTDRDVLEVISAKLGALLDLASPGVKGIEGTETTPELVLRRFTLSAGQVISITGNRRRARLTIRALSGAVELHDTTGLFVPGWQLAAEKELSFEHSTNSVQLTAGPDGAEVQTCEESS